MRDRSSLRLAIREAVGRKIDFGVRDEGPPIEGYDEARRFVDSISQVYNAFWRSFEDVNFYTLSRAIKEQFPLSFRFWTENEIEEFFADYKNEILYGD